MNKAIRRMWLMVAGIVMVLLLTLTYVQFFAADALQANPWNNRTLYEQFGQDRGSILVDGQEIAKSVPSNDDFEHQRVYTDSPMYSNLTGYFSLVYGATGLESAMGDELSGASDDQFYDRVVSLFSGDQPKGASVELTLDSKLQKVAYNALEGHNGSIVAVDPKTGEIKAMVSRKSYDANAMSSHNTDEVVAAADQLNADPAQPLVNRAIGGDLYAPGSTFKLIDTVAALESGKYTTDTTIPNPSELPLPDTTVTLPNYRQGGCAARSQVNLQFALEQSCNTPFAQIAMELGQDEIRKTAENFGYGQELSIPLEVTPSVFPEEMNQAQLALSSIGQYDVRTTPLQVAMTSAAIANDGVMMKPSLVKNVRSSDLSVIDEFKAEQLRRSTDAETAQTVTELMTSVVDNGIASGAAVPGVKVAGKTGTAETGEDGLNDSWFTGFAPADDPQLAVAVVVEDVDVTTGSTVTSPSARQLFEAVLNK
ncbi:penicillin-binding transpeptidase domain-containing protein [Kocuria rhizophila]|uniref:Penicillin-binding protein 2 n=1 Tax=Kocuria rhizophila TaxID=72000 RepID=A0AAX2S9L4_KOCRH|nr:MULTISPECIES: penicillin-binding transpeptidase domain-containing protein [Kocuria]MCR4525337.1 penicillin-binding transpeptidase domain-containing protein [Kocuria rhizophila]MCT1545235.1 penicillin-binding transpeptidase domain-containing protein [Kocuria rhizophila]MCT2170740.1 penicillin-binding transpeptidase domain-containing protein [Kocuria rhizophila]MDA4829814.1 penicillin-binding transpeptidase domain-containing protein [Kocuria rhizophila]MDN3463214.1 penicillin-binding transpep